jgi:hypothetical protein
MVTKTMAPFTAAQARTVHDVIAASTGKIGIAADGHRIAVALSTGETWSAALTGKSAYALAAILAGVNRPVWTAEPVHTTAVALATLGAGQIAMTVRNTTAAEAICPAPSVARATAVV